MYETLFRESIEREGHTFGFLLSERKTMLRHGAAIEHAYSGSYRVVFEPNEYCDIFVFLSFCERGGDDPIEQTPFGYTYFGQVKADSKKGHSPSIHLLVRETGGLSEQFSSLFAEVKAAGGAGVEAIFNVDLKSMLGQDAKSVWGSWARSNEHLPGRRNFPFKSLEFSALIK
ncbi:MAG: hypothetical protein U1D69_06105 [Polynucleobacter sp.]|uniref:hypothetical protein n=1 Tax=Limnobacter sp. TaxID=2003368 RepID=UPI002734945F|nr:hypothetical protein [Limnobacter sp.]MDP3272046.1 hypothetical protein [Limnobacter sp.]MDZ4056532.1 hypothetical protein [Polynucleobacter sp.]